MVGWAEMPRSPGHVFYDRLQSVLIEGGFDGFAEAACRSITRPGWGRLRCRRGAISACTWWATSRASTLSAGWNGAARIPCRYGSGWKAGIRTIPGCHGPARACPMRSHGDLRLGSGSDRRGGSGQGRAHRGRCLDHGGQRGAAQHRAEGHGRGLPGDAGALGPSRHPRPRTWRAWTASARARSSRTRTGSRRATPRPRSPR